MNQHPVPMPRQALVPALGRGQVQELARYKLPNSQAEFPWLCRG
jgi:hypothetical protein